MPIKVQGDLPAKAVIESENIFIMDETHTILSAGAGGVTKMKAPYDKKIERIFNFKYPYEYIERFELMNERKEQVRNFYEKYPLRPEV